jgi:hypothetical protein
VHDAAPRLGLTARATRALAFVGSALLVLVPLLLYFSTRRADSGFFIMSGYCLTVAVATTMALAFRDRFSFWAGLSINVLGVLSGAGLFAYLAAQGDPDAWTVLFIAAPAALNLVAVLLMRRARGPSDDTVATR